MNQHTIRTPFFEIGPKSYLYGQAVVDLAIAADKASEKYGVDIIFTTPIISISAVKAATKHIHVFAPHMDPLEPGRGLADHSAGISGRRRRRGRDAQPCRKAADAGCSEKDD